MSAGATGPLEQVGPIDAGSGHPDEDVVVAGLRDGPVLDDEAAAFLDDEGPHGRAA